MAATPPPPPPPQESLDSEFLIAVEVPPKWRGGDRGHILCFKEFRLFERMLDHFGMQEWIGCESLKYAARRSYQWKMFNGDDAGLIGRMVHPLVWLCEHNEKMRNDKKRTAKPSK